MPAPSHWLLNREEVDESRGISHLTAEELAVLG